jgi:hypothetical protein
VESHDFHVTFLTSSPRFAPLLNVYVFHLIYLNSYTCHVFPFSVRFLPLSLIFASLFFLSFSFFFSYLSVDGLVCEKWQRTKRHAFACSLSFFSQYVKEKSMKATIYISEEEDPDCAGSGCATRSHWRGSTGRSRQRITVPSACTLRKRLFSTITIRLDLNKLSRNSITN